MRTNFIFIGALALAAMACAKVAAPEADAPVSFQAYVDGAQFPDTKAVIALNSDAKPQTFWENGDKITVYTSADGTASTQSGYAFSTSLSANSATAAFSYSGTDFGSGNYLAIYPATGSRAVNFTGTDDIFKMAAVDVPTSQTLVAGEVDKKAMIMTAYAPEGTSILKFCNAVALVKFQVADSDIKGGSIITDGADAISGRFRADLSTTAPYEPVLSVYNAGGVAEHNFVNFTIDDSTPLQTGTDYYVAVRPTTLTAGFKIYLNGNLVKSVTCTALERNKIYNAGTLSVPASPSEKGLAFDFTVTPKAGWPTAVRKPADTGNKMECVYPLHGTDYTFVLADCVGATASSAAFWATTTPINRMSLSAQYRYLGVPAVAGYKLVKVTCTNARSTKPAQIGIVKSISGSVAHPADSDYLTGGSKVTWTKTGNETRTYALSGTEAGIMYYIYAYANGDFTGITLTYEKE